MKLKIGGVKVVLPLERVEQLKTQAELWHTELSILLRNVIDEYVENHKEDFERVRRAQCEKRAKILEDEIATKKKELSELESELQEDDKKWLRLEIE